ncbi:MAG: hypothetical protein HFJ41_03620 [Clostridia bacterium]|nr:hypothetical protein [Clostridia bacterium]
MARTYKPYGVVNIFNVVPGFVYVVLERDGKFYFPHDDYNSFKIEYFYKVPPSVIKNIRSFDEFTCNQKFPKELTLNSNFPFAFQVNEKELQIGTFNDLVSFFSTYKTNNEILKKEITEFIMNQEST